MAEDADDTLVRRDLGGGGLAAFSRAAFVFRLQFDRLALKLALLGDGHFGPVLLVQA
jgi:hypothetical protein